jgi:hypothetical protein
MGASRLLTFDTTSALLISSGRDWTDRTKHIAARAGREAAPQSTLGLQAAFSEHA